MKRMILTTIMCVSLSIVTVSVYHFFVIKYNYISKVNLYVVDTNKILSAMAEMYAKDEITRDEFLKRAGELQERLKAHNGLVFELGALPGRVENDIQAEFEDLIKK